MAQMSSDKKVKDGKIGFVVAGGVGKAELHHDIPATEALAVLREMLGEERR